MTDVPERIWAVVEPDDVSADILGDVYAQQVPDGMVGKPTPYIPEDLALAMVAAAYHDAADRLFDWHPVEARRMIRALTPDDARAALNRMLADATPSRTCNTEEAGND